ncbi:hypothetical protein BGZ72_004935 [Mortierella alpina]|nr:hypothetical protein BGZ72_004935 [Mortierella alpina]
MPQEIPSVSLQRIIFPVVNDTYPDQDWQTWREDIMMDRDEYTDRKLDHREAAHYPMEDSPKIKFFIILVHMRKVNLQDAAAPMVITTDPECQYCLHTIFHEPVFSPPLFLQFRESLKEMMFTSTSPTNDSLLANAPTIHDRLRDISEQLADMAQLLNHKQ